MLSKIRFISLITLFFVLVMMPPVLLLGDSIKISGTVIDQSSKKPLAGANIVLESTNMGTITNINGEYSIDAFSSQLIISASYIGYDIAKKQIEVNNNSLQVNFELRSKVLPGQEVVVTSTRAVERETPVAFVDLPREELVKRYWSQDIPMLLSEVPGIYSYSDAGNGLGYTYLKIRGFDQKRVSVMINGIPLNDPEDHQVYWVDMPDFLSSVHDIQIQRGVGSSIYGANSFGGTVNIQTSDLNLPRQIKLSTGMGSYNTQKYSFNLNSGLIDNQYAFSARFSKISSDGYRDNSEVDMWSYYLSAARYTLKTSTFINVYGGPEMTHASWEASPESQLRENHRHNPLTYKNSIDNFNQPHYELHHRWAMNDKLTWNNSVYYIHGEGYYEGFKSNKKLYDFGYEPFYLPDSSLVERTNLVRQKWVDKDQLGMVSRMDLQHRNGTLTFGVDGYLFKSKHWGNVAWAAQLPANASPEDKYYGYKGDKKAFSLFAHELYRLTENLSLMGDLNFQYKTYDFKQDEYGNFYGISRHAYNVDYNFFSPKFGVNYNINKNLNIFTNISVAHREPTDTDLFDVWQGPDDVGVAPLFSNADTVKNSSGEVEYLEWNNPLTKPEDLLDFEFGLGYTTQKFKLKLNGYWMNFNNEIVPYSQVDKDGFPIKGNADHTIHRGVEGSFGLEIVPGLDLSGAMALSQNYFEKFIQYEAEYDENWNFAGNKEIDFNGKTIAGFPGTMANLKLQYSKGLLSSYLFLQHVGKQYLDNTESDERSISAYSLLNIHLSYSLKNIIGLNDLRLSFWINNLLDESYETAGYYDAWEGENFLWPGADRNFFIGLETTL